MARQQGTFPISANYEVRIKGTFDARQLVDDVADLYNFNSANYIPYGFTVSVKGLADSATRGIYMCIDENNLSLPASWIKITGTGGGASNWGDLAGNVEDQTDLVNYIDSKTTLQNVLEQGSDYLGSNNIDITVEDVTNPLTDYVSFTIEGDPVNSSGFVKRVGVGGGDYKESSILVSDGVANLSVFTSDNGSGSFGSTFVRASDDEGIVLLDGINSIGARYTSDYSANNTGANYNPRWIPDLEYVNSISDLQGTIEAGGFYSGTDSVIIAVQDQVDTGRESTFYLGNGALYYLSSKKGISSQTNYRESILTFDPTRIQYTILKGNGTSSDRAGLHIQTMGSQYEDGIVIVDDIYNQGVLYDKDFSANNLGVNENDRWIPDVAGVKSLISTYSGGGGSSTWGSITGTITDQTDLTGYIDDQIPEGTNGVEFLNGSYQLSGESDLTKSVLLGGGYSYTFDFGGAFSGFGDLYSPFAEFGIMSLNTQIYNENYDGLRITDSIQHLSGINLQLRNNNGTLRILDLGQGGNDDDKSIFKNDGGDVYIRGHQALALYRGGGDFFDDTGLLFASSPSTSASQGIEIGNVFYQNIRFKSGLSYSNPLDVVPKTYIDSNFALQSSLSDYLTVSQYNSERHFKGTYTSLANLTTAEPTANAGDFANIDAGVGSTVQRAIWDNDDSEWVISASGGGSVESVNGQIPDGSGNVLLNLTHISDTDFTSLTNGDLIKYNGTNFVNVPDTDYARPLDKSTSEALPTSIDFSLAAFQPKSLSGTLNITAITNPQLGTIVLPVTGGSDITIDTGLIPAERIRGAFNSSKSTNVLKITCYDASAPSYFAVWELEGGGTGGGTSLIEYEKNTSLTVTGTVADITSLDASPIDISSEGVTVNETTGVITLAANGNYNLSISANYLATSGTDRSTIDVLLTQADNTEIWKAHNYIRASGDRSTLSFSKTVMVGGTDLDVKFRHVLSKGTMPIDLESALIKIQKI
jgi:hypothetical protein